MRNSIISKTMSIATEMCDYYFGEYYVKLLAEELKKKYPDKLDGKDEALKAANNTYSAFKNKNFKYFIVAAENFSARPGFTDGKDFIASVMEEGFLRPQQLKAEPNWNNFLRNSGNFLKKKENPSIILLKKIKVFIYSLKGKTIKENLGNYFFAQKILFDYGNANLDLTVLCFSKSFRDFSIKEGMDIDFREEQHKLAGYKKIVAKLKEKLGDDFFEEN